MTKLAQQIQQQAAAAFEQYAHEGVLGLALAPVTPTISHICFKFQSMESYKRYIEAAERFSLVSHEQFKGKEITWCKLDAPLVKDDIVLEWLEMVEPKTEQNEFDGVTSIGYVVPGLPDMIKNFSEDKAILFRYSPTTVHP